MPSPCIIHGVYGYLTTQNFLTKASTFFINKLILEMMALSIGRSSLQATDLHSWGREMMLFRALLVCCL